MKLKIFEIYWTRLNEKSWVSAESNIHAIQVYCQEKGFELSYFDGDEEIDELPKSQWDEYFVTDDDDDETETSFTEFMKNNQEPCVIAETANIVTEE